MVGLILKGIASSLLIIIGVVLIVPTAMASEALASPEVNSMTLVHYAKLNISSSTAPPLNNVYYELLGLKLNSTFTYYVNPKGNGLDQRKAVEQIRLSFDAWNATTDVPLFNYGGLTSKGFTRDGQSTLSWAKLDTNTILAKIVIWYISDTDGDGFDEIIESDTVFNSLLKWGVDSDGEGGNKYIKVFDIRNVATHEAGHVVGLAGLHDDAYRELSMYEYSSNGQTQKISLEGGDVTGAQYLYGPRTSRIW